MSAWGRSVWLAVLVAAIVVVPRSLLVTAAHNESWDDEYHLVRGLMFLARSGAQLEHNDPPLGEGLIAVPLVLSGCVPAEPVLASGLYGQRLSPETIRLLVAGWKAILFLPLVGVAFAWCRRLYGAGGAWLATALLLVEPTFAAHVPIAALDVLAVEGIVIACYLGWRYAEEPTRGRLIATAVATAAAMLTKHTAVITPAVIAGLIVLHRAFPRPRVTTDDSAEPGLRRRAGWRSIAGELLRLAAVGLLALWALTLFDVSSSLRSGTGSPRWFESTDWRVRLLQQPVPAGRYWGTFLSAAQHAQEGHPGYLWGERRTHGWWYYYPAVALYKVPVGVAIVLALAVASLWRRRLRFDELGLLVPLAAWTVFLMGQSINIGFRHFLAPYAFALMWAGRAVAGAGTGWKVAAWAGVAAAAVHVATFHPDYLAYVNAPRDKVYLAIGDSNLDWGQGLKQAGAWIEANVPPDRTVYVRPMIDDLSKVPRFVGDRPIVLGPDDPAPASGILVISPVWVTGQYDPLDRYAFLREREPLAVIGHSMLVFDLGEQQN